MYKKPKPQSNHDDVGDFHEKFGLDNTTNHDTGPRAPLSAELLNFRVNFLLEEIGELVQALGGTIEISDIVVAGARSVVAVIPEGTEIDHVGAFDALLDINYVSHGTAHLMGYPWQDGWDEVQRANMTKQRAERAEQSTRGGTWDVIKPPGWTAPNIEGVLEAHSFELPVDIEDAAK